MDKVADSFGIVQQVQAVVQERERLREENAKLQEKIVQLNADIKRILEGKR